MQQAGDEVEKTLADTYRQEFRRLGVTQRQILADFQRLADDARKELDALNQKPDDQKSPEERLQAGQYTNMLRFLDSGLQRLNQSRSLTRRLQGNRAFRRWSAGLSDAKRARDQLRNPVELLGYLMADAAEMAQLTRTLASSSATLSPQDQHAPAPTWLTREYLQDLQASTLDRTTELEQVLASATAKPEPSPTPAVGCDATHRRRTRRRNNCSTTFSERSRPFNRRPSCSNSRRRNCPPDLSMSPTINRWKPSSNCPMPGSGSWTCGG